MKRNILVGMVFAAQVAAQAWSADAPPADAASAKAAESRAASQELQPAVNTSAAVPAPAAPAGPVAARPAAAKPAPAKPAATGRSARAQDQLELDTTQITGNRELPRVLYVVPWKRSDLGDLAGKPANSLLDEVLAPVDRDVFKRQNRYYDALKPDAASTAPAGAEVGK